MSGLSLPVTRPAGRALIVAGTGCRPEPMGLMLRQGFQCGEAEDPYAAMVELARRPLAYRSIVLSLQSLYREELPIIATIKQRWPHMEVWVTQADGRASSLADAMRFGADGTLTDHGLVRTAQLAPRPPSAAVSASSEAGPISSVSPISSPAVRSVSEAAPLPLHAADEGAGESADRVAATDVDAMDPYIDEATGEPVLTADELRALLQDPPMPQPSSNE